MTINDLKTKFNLQIRGIIVVGSNGEDLGEYIDMGVQNILAFEQNFENFKKLTNIAHDINLTTEGYQVRLCTEDDKCVTIDDEEIPVASLDQYNTHDYNFLIVYAKNALEVLEGGRSKFAGGMTKFNERPIDYVYCESDVSKFLSKYNLEKIDDSLYGRIK